MSVNPSMSRMNTPIAKLRRSSLAYMEERLRLTTEFIAKAHGDQMHGNLPFYFHPVRVMYRIMEVPRVTEATLHAALLHDVVEDTETTLEDLWYKKYPWQTLEAVDHLTRYQDGRRGKTYKTWIKWLAKYGNEEARLVKYADAIDNRLSSGSNQSLRKRYDFVIATLGSTLDNQKLDKVYDDVFNLEGMIQ